MSSMMKTLRPSAILSIKHRCVLDSGTQTEHSKRLDVAVIHTNLAGTLAALRSAAKLAHGLHSRIRIVVPHVVPYPLPLDKPDVSTSFLANHFRTISKSAEVDTTVEIRLCRDPWDALNGIFTTASIEVVGGRDRWWPTKESRLAQRLRNAGHQVIFTESK